MKTKFKSNGSDKLVVRLQVVVDKRTDRLIAKHAAAERRSVSNWIRILILEKIKEQAIA